MRNYTNTTSQQARQFAANAALDAAEVMRRRAARLLGVTLTNHAEIVDLVKCW